MARVERMRVPGAVVLVGVLVFALVTLGLLLAAPTEDDDVPPTTTAPTTTTPQAVDTTTAVYPSVSSSIRFDDPVGAARAFAVDFVGFVEPVVGPFLAGDSQSGEVEIRPAPSGPVTTVLVRRLGSSWWVLGATSTGIVLEEPAPLALVASPVRVRGRSTSFEGTVTVEVRQDGGRHPLGVGSVTGGAAGALEPFDGTVAFADPFAPMGAIVLSTASMESGRLWEASVVRVRLAPSGTVTPVSACPDYEAAEPRPGPGEMVVTIYLTCDGEDRVVPTYRLAPASPAVLRTALELLMAGPSAAETAAGLRSWFSPATVGMVAEATIADGHAVVDFHDLRDVLPNASASAGSALLLSQLDATVFQFPSVRSVTYRIAGDCATFGEWLQVDGCIVRSRPGA